ncbi:MAG: flagellar FlbD family protein [Peptococcaceae bacterium]|jgi:flagellar protein FlbD|nr:flagellar FlbD family protein [Peptococcaceae bacterium]
MIMVTRLNGKEFAINPDLIEILEQTPDTIITLTNSNKYIVKESTEVIIDRIASFRRKCHPDYKGGAYEDKDK